MRDAALWPALVASLACEGCGGTGWLEYIDHYGDRDAEPCLCNPRRL